jgi:hypothetical protein
LLAYKFNEAFALTITTIERVFYVTFYATAAIMAAKKTPILGWYGHITILLSVIIFLPRHSPAASRATAPIFPLIHWRAFRNRLNHLFALARGGGEFVKNVQYAHQEPPLVAFAMAARADSIASFQIQSAVSVGIWYSPFSRFNCISIALRRSWQAVSSSGAVVTMGGRRFHAVTASSSLSHIRTDRGVELQPSTRVLSVHEIQ